MPSVLVTYSCPHCKEAIQRSESWIDPALYSKPAQAVKKSIFYCPHSFSCGKAMGFTLVMKPGQVIEIQESIVQSDIFSIDRVYDYNLKSDEDENGELKVDLGDVLDLIDDNRSL